jgi:hypothetical protein
MRVPYLFSSRRTGRIENMCKQREKYPDLLNKVVEKSDIILEVVDARFSKETRNKEVEALIKSQKKQLILILNKCDLAGEKIARPYENYVMISCKNKKGIGELRDKIKIAAKKIANPLDKRTGKVTVGIIGYPNTGKSTVINTLIGKRSAPVAAQAGFTKGIQKINLSPDIVLMDSPGVISKEKYSDSETGALSFHTKVGSRSYSQVKNPGIVISDLVKEYQKAIDKYYNLETKGDSEILIEEIGRKRGFMKKGGEVDEDKTARSIIKDWQDGKIKI